MLLAQLLEAAEFTSARSSVRGDRPASKHSPDQCTVAETCSRKQNTLQEVKQAHTAIEPLLTAVWHAEFLQRFDLYRAAIVLLADVGLEFGLTQWCGRLIDEILPQVCFRTLPPRFAASHGVRAFFR